MLFRKVMIPIPFVREYRATFRASHKQFRSLSVVFSQHSQNSNSSFEPQIYFRTEGIVPALQIHF